MNKKFKILVFIAAILSANSALFAQSNKDFERRVNSIASLLSESSVSRQIRNSGSDVAKQYFKYAQVSFDNAVGEYRKGDLKQADFHLKNSKKAIFEAIMYANLKGTGNEQDRHDYETKRRSVNALTDALRRVSATKDKTEETQIIINKVTELTKQADQEYFKKHYKKAIAIVHRALELVEATIVTMRTGDTLVNTLSFDSAEDEYNYELDRNDTHFMLLSMFLSEFPDDDSLNKIVAVYKSAATEHRNKAEELASHSKYKKAIKELEISTMKIIRAIKSTGSYIPG
ncbi:MAG: hypothetical protein OEW89_01595 [Gammaproteobacteria bacterium]|nr:hypothetical protein [Gammaproteobacteria bacterium]MDH5592932.1 hypothetical protein [Gammaproteobacteria bacterium]